MSADGPKDVSSAAQVEHHLRVSDHGIDIDDLPVTLDSDDLRNQMAAQIKATKLPLSSAATIQMILCLFVAYCSEL